MEISLLGSLSSIAAVVGTPLTGVLLDLLGRKYCCILFSLAPVISWAILSFTRRVEVVLLSVFLSGLVGTSFMIVPNFINEITQDSIRGSLTSTEAVEAICFYRSEKPNSKIVLQEIDNLRKILSPQFNNTQPEEETLKPESAKKLTKWQFIRKHKPTVRGFFIALTLLSLSIFQGVIVVQVYAQLLFEDTLPNMSATWSSIAFALVNVLSGLVAAYLLDVFGRRPIMIYSSLLTCLFCTLLGSHLQLHWAPSWLAAALIFLYCMTVTSGANIVPFVIVAEIFLPEVRGVMSMLVIESGWIWNFLMLVIFNPFMAAVGMGPVFYIFALISLLTAIFTSIYLPETKGLTVQDIQTLLERRQRSLH
ncbi:sugar transporter 12 [Danaus plexippus plexippus]|uniref:Sugar transporter 12 n=1 Tax=Danaus plexippus plexippus TaxID=278856 RepID=A0A212F6E9_DANPL|nr:sugar transporter 12 [Danaus plexippus plexippus]